MNHPLDIYSLIGFVGTACIIGAYFYLTAVERPNPYILHGTNLTGAALLTISLLVHTNWPSLVLEGFWAAIAIWGLSKAFMRTRHPREGGDPESPAHNPASLDSRLRGKDEDGGTQQ